jgi:hypothetical protein
MVDRVAGPGAEATETIAPVEPPRVPTHEEES